MKEADAKTKWCPETGGAGRRVDGRIATAGFCIGSDCVWWRALAPVEDQPAGYCGAIGKPQ